MVNMSTDIIKRCPFCGGEDLMVGSIPYSIGADIYIKCRTCGAKMQICEEYGDDELRRRWNTRKPMKRIVEQLEERRNDYIYDGDDYCEGAYNAFDEAIAIVKEAGGADER